MVANGRVQHGVVVLEEGVRLPEGLKVTVVAPRQAGVGTAGLMCPRHKASSTSPPSVLVPFCIR